ncbi:hypothetical protein [Gimesia sp.]
MRSFCGTASKPVPKIAFVLNARIIAIDLNVCPRVQAFAGKVERDSFR